MTPPSNPLPLAGIVVVSCEQAVAAPFATRQLAELGARVIKVERPGGGDFARAYDEKAEIGFGSQIRNYVLQPDQWCKDLRTEVKVGNPHAVLDGGLDVFIDAYLRKKLARGEVKKA